MIRIVLFAAVVTLGACASAPSGPSDLDRLRAQCRARDGDLQPIPGANHPNEAANWACVLPAGPEQPFDGPHG